MIQEIAPHKFDNQMKFIQPKEHDKVLVFSADEVAVKEENGICEPYEIWEIREKTGGTDREYEYLFCMDEISYYMVREHIHGLHYVLVSSYRTMQPQHIAFAVFTAHQLYRFYNKHNYCGCCGAAMKKSTTERAFVCTECGNTVYPRISPAVTIAITDGDRIVLAKSAYGTFRKFALVAGYVEIGETLEETVHREVMEEVGLEVKNVRYYKSQPWASSDAMMIGFVCELDGDDTIHIQESELSEARWFYRHEIEEGLPQTSLSFEMIEKFRINEL